MIITIEQLKALLDEQKEMVIDRLKSNTYYYNKESTDGHLKPLPIDEEKFREIGRATHYPHDFQVLIKYTQ